MRKWISLILVLILILGLAGCSSEKVTEPTPKPTPRPTPTPTPHTADTRRSDSDIKSMYFNYNPKNCSNIFNYELMNAVDGCNSVKLVEVASIDVEWDADGGIYGKEYYTGKVILKGNFWAYDEYGNSLGKYNFDMEFNFRDYGYDLNTTYPNHTSVKKS